MELFYYSYTRSYQSKFFYRYKKKNLFLDGNYARLKYQHLAVFFCPLHPHTIIQTKMKHSSVRFILIEITCVEYCRVGERKADL